MPGVYTQAAILDPDLKHAYTVCRRIVRRRDPDEYALAQLIPPALRPAGWAVWAAGSMADDLVDHSGDPQRRAAALGEWTTTFKADLERGTSGDPVRRALVHTMLTWNFSPGDVYAALHMLHQDIRHKQPATWEQWRTHRASLTVGTVNGALVLAGVSFGMPVRLRDLDSWRRWLDALLLIDSLEDLSADLTRGHLDWPDEAFRQAGADPVDLLDRRWTPGVKALTEQVNAQALRWLRLDPVGLPPWLAMLFGTVTAMYRARLWAVRAAGPALLHRRPRPSPATRWRILAPARAQAALMWRLAPVAAPAPTATSAAPPATGPAAPDPLARTAEVPLPPVPHPSGARPPELPPEHMPRHVAIVMDGNGRWATQRGLPRTEGHQEGGRALRDIVHGALEIGLPHLTVYAFSTENWKRSPEEVEMLMSLVRTFDRDQEDDLLNRDVRVRWCGSEQGMPADILDGLYRLEDATRHRTGLTCTLCVNYGGRTELALAAGALARAACAGEVDPARVSERTLARYLSHPDLPDVDLLWRPGGERRTSNFLLWQSAYAEIHFTETLWPDTDRRHLWQAITAYTRRERRYGSVPAPRPTRRPPATELPAPDTASPEAAVTSPQS